MEDCIKKQHEFSALLAHSGYEIKKGKIVLLPEGRDMYEIYYENSRSGERVSLREIDKINDFISNKDFKKVTLIKENGQVKQMNGERHIIADDDTKFVQLKHQFPHSDISTSVYNGGINKYIITQKELLGGNDAGDIF